MLEATNKEEHDTLADMLDHLHHLTAPPS
ncbi:hypothetical protein SMF913_24997 [Streptomyces malaysiensis]|uniref:Uncharacterized protein n=1 Tax=Streptomyces malaysiensis TaxID=92644 RepID=A0A2J7YND4_STRMQ|nr:hypothetical protein SMF913_24997 [Streptomyces malaysiensis]